jgi:hypothetical protein
MKAMLAASQCPHCGHLFELRDGFGEFVPLAHCASCDSYYPLSQGTCHWCGTKPESFRVAPYAVKGVGVLVFAGLVGAAWLTNRSDNDDAPPTTTATKPAALTTVVDSGLDFQPPVLAGIEDTLSDPSAITLASDSSAAVPADTATQQQFPAVDSTPPGPSALMSARAPATAKAPARPARTARWVRATARRWVTVRASATHKSRIVAAIGPDTRVQLGEARGDWRRIRTKGIAGWVERGKF